MDEMKAELSDVLQELEDADAEDEELKRKIDEQSDEFTRKLDRALEPIRKLRE
jgi:hypothetical protein